jgi:hypothetical protein
MQEENVDYILISYFEYSDAGYVVELDLRKERFGAKMSEKSEVNEIS